MNGYERQCRWLLRAFPLEFRHQRGDDLIGTLLDDAPPGARRVPVATAVDLIVSGSRMRVAHAGAASSIRRSAADGMALAAVVGLGVQAALAVASAVYQGEHGLVFYLPAGGPFGPGRHPMGAQYLVTWIALAAVSVAAFAAAVRAAWRTAAALSLLASAYLITVAAIAVASVPAAHIISAGGGPGPTAASSRYVGFTATPGLLSIGAVAAGLAVFTAIRARRRPARRRSLWWLAAAAGLALTFSLVGDGNAARGPASHLTTAYPAQGGIMTVLQILVAVSMVTAVIWTVIDPRVGWATAVLGVPFVVHQISDLTLGNFYYGYLYQPGWETALPLILALTGITALATSAAMTVRRIRRP